MQAQDSALRQAPAAAAVPEGSCGRAPPPTARAARCSSSAQHTQSSGTAGPSGGRSPFGACSPCPAAQRLSSAAVSSLSGRRSLQYRLQRSSAPTHLQKFRGLHGPSPRRSTEQNDVFSVLSSERIPPGNNALCRRSPLPPLLQALWQRAWPPETVILLCLGFSRRELQSRMLR